MPRPAQSAETSRVQAWLLILPLVLLTGFASALAGGCTPMGSNPMMITVNKTDVADPVSSGGTIEYVINVQAQGDTPNGILLNDILPAGVTLQSGRITFFNGATPPANDPRAACLSSSSPSIITCSIPSAVGSTSATVRITVTAPVVTQPTTITNVVEAFGDRRLPAVANDSENTLVTPATPSPLTCTGAGTDDYLVGDPVNESFTCNGGRLPYTATETTGDFPGGVGAGSCSGGTLGVNGGNVVMGGSFTSSGSCDADIEVRDSSTPQQFFALVQHFRVFDRLQMTTTTLANGVDEAPYSDVIVTTGGSAGQQGGGLVIGLAPGSNPLPPGLSIAADPQDPHRALLQGIATTGGTYTFTIEARDTLLTSQVVTQMFTIEVLEITTATMPEGFTGQSYSQTLASLGVSSVAFWQVISGMLPNGLSLDAATGDVHGTPTQTGTFNFTVQLDGGTGPDDMQALSITIYDPLVITTATLVGGDVNTQFNQVVATSGGSGNVTFSVITGSLPPGVTLDPNSGQLIGTPTQGGIFNFEVEARDTVLMSQVTSQFYTLKILEIETTSLPGGTVGAPYSILIQTRGGASGTWTIVTGPGQTGPPPGLMFGTPIPGGSPAELFSGTPMQAGTYDFTVHVADGTASDTQIFTVTIAPAPTPPPKVAYIYSADGNSNTVSIFELAETGQLTFTSAVILGGAGNTTGVATAEVGTGTVLAATYADNKVAVATANADGTVTPWPNSPFTTAGSPRDPEFYFDGSNLFLYFISDSNAIEAFLLNTAGQTLNQVPGAPFLVNTTVQDIQVNAARKTLDIVPTSTALQTHVIPHILDTTGAITPGTQFSFDTTVFSTYSGLGSGTGAVTTDSGSIQLYLFDQTSGQQLLRDSEVCEACTNIRISPRALCVSADEQPVGLPARKATFQIDELHGGISRVGSFSNPVQLGYGIMVVTGDTSGTNILNFVVNTHTGPFDLSVFGFAPEAITASTPSAPRDVEFSAHTDPPGCTMNGQTPFTASSAGGGALAVAAKILFAPPQPQPPILTFTTTVTANSVALDASSSAVTNGVITQIFWDCDSDGTYDQIGEAPQCTYAAPGTYNITALAINNIGQSTTLTQPVVIPAILTAITITPNPISIADGLNLQLTATGFFNDNTTQDLTNVVTWSSSNTGFATVSNTGVLTAVDPGMTDVTATFGSFSDSITVTVTQASLASIDVSPPSATVVLGVPLTFTATGTFTDGSTQDVTQTATWTSSNTAVATVANGQVTSLTTGTTNITAAIGSTSDTALVTVNPSQPPVALFSCVETSPFTLDCDASASNDPDGGVIQAYEWDYDNNGAFEATGVTTSHGYGAAGTFTVTLRVTDDEGSTATTSQQFTLTAPQQPPVASYVCTSRASDPRIVDCDGSASNDPDGGAIALYEWDFDNDAVIDASGVTVTHTFPVSGAKTIVLRVTDDENVSATLSQPFIINPVLLNLMVTPDQPSVADGLTQQFTATGFFDDGSNQDVTNTVTWSTSNGAFGTVSATGLFTAVDPGIVDITAALGTISDSTTVTVTNAAAVSLDVTPDSISIADGLDQQFTAIAIFSDGSSLDVTNIATWTTSVPAVATVSGSGLMHSVDPGAVQISATYTDTFGTVADSSTVTVTQAVLNSVVITPDPPPTIADGRTQQFTATGTFSDGGTSDITNTCLWSTSDPATATIDPLGLATGVNPGTTTVTADCSGFTDNVTLNVTAAVLDSIAIFPDPLPTVTVNGTTQLTAIGTFSDATTQDVTQIATWTSSDNAIATVSDAPGSKGFLTGVALGTFSVTASIPPFTDTAFGTVSSVALQLITGAQTNEVAVNNDPGFFVQINNNGSGAAGNPQLNVTVNGATLTGIFGPFDWTCTQNGNSASCTAASLGGFAGAAFFLTTDTSALTSGGNVTLDATLTSASPVINLQSQTSATVYPALQLIANLAKAGGNVPYAGQLATTGGKGPITYGIQFGSFPAGLNLDANSGAVTGIATAGGSFPITLFAQDSLNQFATSNTNLEVLFISTLSLPNGSEGRAYNQTVTVIGQTIDPNTVGQFSISAGALPDGLMIDAFTGVISGTPTVPATFMFTVKYEETIFSMTGGPNIVTTATQPYTVTIVGAGVANLAITSSGPPTVTPLLPIVTRFIIDANAIDFTGSQVTLQASPQAVIDQVNNVSGGSVSFSPLTFTQGNSTTGTFSLTQGSQLIFDVVWFTDTNTQGTMQSVTGTLTDPNDTVASDNQAVAMVQVANGFSQILVLPQNFTLVVGEPDVQFQAFAVSNNAGTPTTLYEITELVTWSSTNNTIATVSNTSPKGVGHPISDGGVTFRAQAPHGFGLGQSSGSVSSIVGLTVTPGILNQAVGNTLQMTANLLLSNGALYTDVTNRAIWTSNGPGTFTIQSAGDTTPGLVTMTGTGNTSGSVMDPVTGHSRSFTVNGYATQPALTYILGATPNFTDTFYVDPVTGDLHFVGTHVPINMGFINTVTTCEQELFAGFGFPNSVSGIRVDNTTGLPMHWHTVHPVDATPSEVAASKPCTDVGATLTSDSSVQMFSRSGPDLTPIAKTSIPGTFPVKMFFNHNHPFAYVCNGDQLRVLNHDAGTSTVTDTNTTRDYAFRRDFALSRNGDALYIITWNSQTNASTFNLQQLSNGQLGGPPISVPLSKAAFAVYSDPDQDVAYVLHFDSSVTTVQLNIAAGSVTIGPNLPLPGLDNIVIIPNLPWLYYVDFFFGEICRVNRATGGVLSGTPACFAASAPTFYQRLVYSPKN